MTPKKLIRAARGEIPADLVLKGGRVINVFTCEIVETDVALAEGTIVGLGLVKGFGLQRGALASSVSHDSHQIVVIGRDPAEIFLAVKTVEALNGGLVVVSGREVTVQLPLPIAGLMSDQPLKTVIEQKDRLLKAAAATGCQAANPFMVLSFLALPVIPELRITDRGLVDVNRMEIIPLFD